MQVVQSELREDISGVRAELREDISGVRAELREDIAGVKSELRLLRWVLGLVVAGVMIPLLRDLLGLF